jgi:sulfur-carrier protein
MPRVELTSHLSRHVPGAEPADVPGTTVREVLDAYFAKYAGVREYVLDEQGTLRKHVVVFVHDTQARDRTGLTDPVAPDQTVYVLQALSGG